MTRLLISALAIVSIYAAGLAAAQAQDGPPQFRPIELWVCNFNDGKDQGDMDDVYEDIVEASGDTAYAAFQLNPYFAGERGQNMDFFYLGAWADGSVMGADMAGYLGTPDEAWDETVDCQGSLMASNWIQPIDAPDDSGNFVMTVSDCDVDHGSSAAQAIGAISRYNDYRVANGMTIGTLVWFPVYGGGEADFDFKLVHVYPGAQQMGDSFKWSVDNAAYNVSNSLRQGLVSCDEARLYAGRTIMNNLPTTN